MYKAHSLVVRLPVWPFAVWGNFRESWTLWDSASWPLTIAATSQEHGEDCLGRVAKLIHIKHLKDCLSSVYKVLASDQKNRLQAPGCHQSCLKPPGYGAGVKGA